MIALRILTEEGIRKFEGYIQGIKNDPQTIYPDLSIETYSCEFQPRVEFDETKTFATRMEMAKYLYECFNNAGIERKKVVGIGADGLWTWLAYVWFEQITAQRKKIQRTERYICSSDWNRYYMDATVRN